MSREQYDLAQKMIGEYEESESRIPDKTQITVRCGICGHKMVRTKLKDNSYSCRTPLITDAYACPTVKIYESQIMDIVLQNLQKQASYALELSLIWSERQKKWRNEAKNLLRDIDAGTEALRRYDTSVKELYELYIEGAIQKEDYVSKKSEMAAEQEAIEERQSVLKARLRVSNENGQINNRYVTTFRKYTDVKELTSEIVTDVLDSVIIFPDRRIEIKWKYHEEYEDLIAALKEGATENEKAASDVLRDRPA